MKCHMEAQKTMDTSISQPPHVLVVDDDDRLRKLLKRYLTTQGFLVSVAANAAEAEKAMQLFHFDVMVLDIMMPGKDGITLAKELKPELKNGELPILILSAKGEPEDRIIGLEAGVDDYLSKPFEPEELTLRLKSLLRRAKGQREVETAFTFGAFEFNPKSNQLTHNGEVVSLTSTELALLAILVNRRGRFVSREELASKCRLNAERNVDIHITRLRKKLEIHGEESQFIQTARGKGYGLFSV